MTFRTKFRAVKVSEQLMGGFGGAPAFKIYEDVTFMPLHDVDPTSENFKWGTLTPTAQVQLHITNPDSWGTFQEHQDYWIDFTSIILDAQITDAPVQTPEVQTPETSTPDAVTTESTTQDSVTQEPTTQDPGTQIQEPTTPETSVPSVNVQAPVTDSAPQESTPEVTEQSPTSQDQGTTIPEPQSVDPTTEPQGPLSVPHEVTPQQ